MTRFEPRNSCRLCGLKLSVTLSIPAYKFLSLWIPLSGDMYFSSIITMQFQESSTSDNFKRKLPLTVTQLPRDQLVVSQTHTRRNYSEQTQLLWNTEFHSFVCDFPSLALALRIQWYSRSTDPSYFCSALRRFAAGE